MSAEPLSFQIGRDGRFVNRESELSALKTFFGQVADKKGRLVFVMGEAGIGKTRLLLEFGKYVRDSGSLFAVGSSYEQEAVSPYAPWTDILRAVLKRTSPHAIKKIPQRILTEVSRILPEMLDRGKELGIKAWLSGPKSPGLFTPTTEQESSRLFQSVTEFVTRSSEAQPLVIFLDDMIWADTASLRLLHHVARRIFDQRIMIVAAYRDVELSEDHPVSRLLLDLNRERILNEVKLGRFTPELLGQLISSQLGGKVSSHLIQLLYNKTGGNPFFVEEVVRSLVEQKAVHTCNQGWALKDAAQVNIPSTVKAAIKQRIGRLSEESFRILSIASVAGMEFNFELLRKVVGFDEDALMGHIETAMKAKLIYEKRIGTQVTYVFADEQIKSFLYDEISLVRKRKYHLRTAQSVEELYSKDSKTHLNELAFHYLQAGHAAKAAEYSDRAGDEAARIYALAEATKHFTNALELLEEAEPQVTLPILTKLGTILFQMGDYRKSIQFLDAATDLAKKLGNATMVADLHRRLAYTHWFIAGNREEALGHCREGLKAIENIKDTPEEAALCQQMARIYAVSGEAEPAARLCHQSIDLAKKLDAWDVLAHAYQTLSLCLPPGEKDTILAYRENALKISSEHGLDEPMCRAYTNLGAYYSYLKGEYRKAEEVYLKGIELSRKLGLPVYVTDVEWELLDQVYFRMGEWDTCKEKASRILEGGSEVGEAPLAAYALTTVFIHLARGEYDEAGRLITRFLPVADRSQWVQVTAKYYEAVSRLHVEKGDLSIALEFALKCDSLASGPAQNHLLGVESKFWKIEVQLKRGEIDKAQRTYEELNDLVDQIGEPWADSLRYWAKGRLESAHRNWTPAVDDLRKAVSILQGVGRKYDAARAMVDSAISLSALTRIDEARASLREAKDVFLSLQSRPNLENVSHLEAELVAKK